MKRFLKQLFCFHTYDVYSFSYRELMDLATGDLNVWVKCTKCSKGKWING